MTDRGCELTRFPAAAQSLTGGVTGAAPRHMSLKVLATLIVVGLSLLLCSAVSAILILNARLATNEETTEAFRLAQTYIDARKELLSNSAAPLNEASELVEDVDRAKHVAAVLLHPDGSVHPLQPGHPRATTSRVPAWFAGLIEADRLSVDFPILEGGDAIGTIRLTSDARDEIHEVWLDFRKILPAILVAGATSLTMSLLLVFGILRRIGACSETLRRIRRGDLSARVPSQESQEFAALAGGINDLASHLGRECEQNRQLLSRLITVRESERQRIASDLHDGMGPCFFALNAALHEARNLSAQLPDGVALKQDLKAALAALARHATSLQTESRSVMSDLRPMLTKDTTLADALADLSVNFLDIAPTARVSLAVGKDCPDSFSELVDLSIYRFAQESVLNAIKHGAANRIAIELTCAPTDRCQGLTVTVTDNGSGPHYPDVSPSYGQIGIADRTSALGGTYKRPFRTQHGVVTEIWIPCP